MRGPFGYGWGPVERSSVTPTWDYWRHGWGFPGNNNYDFYDPGHFLRGPQKPTSVSKWQPKRLPIQHLAHPQNYVIPMATYNVPPNPYTDRAWVARYSREERYRMGQDINWVTLGTKGG